MAAKRRINPTAKMQEAQKYITYMIAKGEAPETIQSLWEAYITDLATGGAKIDVEELVQSVLSQSYLQTNSDIRASTRKVEFYNEMREQIRGDIKKLRNLEQAVSNEIAEYEEKLNSIGDDAQLANVDLQNVLQKQQQTLQMLSTISKLLSDTAMAVIRKIGG